MEKRKHHLTVRVYDSSSKRRKDECYFDRYVLYFPYPKEWVKDGHVGDYLGFNFFSDGGFVQRICWNEWNVTNGCTSNLGRRVNIDELPPNIQQWVRNYEEKWNDYVNNPNDLCIMAAWRKA